jgi:hypothetical protein
MVKEKITSKTIISQILKPEMQIGKQKVTESKRFRPKRRADEKRTSTISGNLIWTEFNGERKKTSKTKTSEPALRAGRALGGGRAGRRHTGASGRRGRDVTS